MEDGNRVLINNKDKSLLYEKEIADENILKAAMEASPDDGAALLLLGSFSKKVFDKRKPRPKDIIRRKQQSASIPIQKQQTLRSDAITEGSILPPEKPAMVSSTTVY